MARPYGERPEWAGVALRFSGNRLVTLQIQRPHAMVEFEQTWERSSFHNYEVLAMPPSRKFWKINLEGEAWDWGSAANGSGLYVPQGEIEARKEIEG